MTQTAQTYGESLYELALEEQLSTEVLEQLQMAVRLFRENPDYAKLLTTPSIPKAERCSILDESFRGRVHPYLLNFMKILVENGTIRQLSGCEQAYRTRYNADNGILEITAITAVPLTPELAQRLSSRLEEQTGKTIHMTNRVDADVIGGVRLEMAGKRLDGTIRNRLDEIQNLLRSTAV